MGKGKSDLALPLTELESYGRRLRSIKTRLNHTKKLFESYRDDIGDGSVNDALGDFESNWEDGREDITQQLDALASSPMPWCASSRSWTTNSPRR